MVGRVRLPYTSCRLGLTLHQLAPARVMITQTETDRVHAAHVLYVSAHSFYLSSNRFSLVLGTAPETRVNCGFQREQ